MLVKATSTPAPAVHPSLLSEWVVKAPLIPPTVMAKSSDALASAAPAVTYGRIQSKATPNLATLYGAPPPEDPRDEVAPASGAPTADAVFDKSDTAGFIQWFHDLEHRENSGP